MDMFPFDPERSPWDVTLIEGLEDGRAALYVRAHHTLTDGVLGLRLQHLDVKGPSDFFTAFAAAKRDNAEAVLLVESPRAVAKRAAIAELGLKHRLPIMSQFSRIVEAGGLMSYGPDLTDLFRRASTYVDKILKGAKPADLPIEQPTKFDLVINLRTAKALGLTIPPSLLLRADQVIE